MDRPIKLSVSALTSFMSCPERFRLGYIEGIRKIEKSDALRIGSSWHALLEAIGDAPDMDTGFDRAIDHLDARYAIVPDGMTAEKWAVERESLAAMVLAYLWNYEEGGEIYESLATELPYDLPVHDPDTGQPLEDVVRTGVIDNLIRLPDGRVAVREYKTTSHDINPASDYWQRLKMDSQISMYLLSARQLQARGLLIPYGIKPGDPPIKTVIYDVIRKAQIKPKNLSQKDTTEVLEGGAYMGRALNISALGDTIQSIDGFPPEWKELKTGVALKETPTMFAARLYQAMVEKPESYFATREVPRTDVELRRFERKLHGAGRTILHMREHNLWYQNENSCDPKGGFKCDYREVCYYAQSTDNGETPSGFRRIFQPTVNGKAVA